MTRRSPPTFVSPPAAGNTGTPNRLCDNIINNAESDRMLLDNTSHHHDTPQRDNTIPSKKKRLFDTDSKASTDSSNESLPDDEESLPDNDESLPDDLVRGTVPEKLVFYVNQCQQLIDKGSVRVSDLDTYQGKVEGSTNASSVIATLLAAIGGNISNEQITQVIDSYSILILKYLCKKRGIDGYVHVDPNDAYRFFTRECQILPAESDIFEGNALDPAAYTDFLDALSRNKSASATFFFRILSEKEPQWGWLSKRSLHSARRTAGGSVAKTLAPGTLFKNEMRAMTSTTIVVLLFCFGALTYFTVQGGGPGQQNGQNSNNLTDRLLNSGFMSEMNGGMNGALNCENMRHLNDTSLELQEETHHQPIPPPHPQLQEKLQQQLL